LVVIVAGRIFSEDSQAGAQVGADGASGTATRTGRVIKERMGRR
jgi:hypothetical protein